MPDHSSTELLKIFTEAVMAQDRCIAEGNAPQGNRHAKEYIAAAKHLLGSGEEVIEDFCRLLEHPVPGVRATAAAFLLKSRTDRAVAALRPIASGDGLAALGAKMTLGRYERGDLEIR